MPLENLARGDKREVHFHLYEADLKLLDNLCAQFGASRATIIAEMLRDYYKAKAGEAGK